MLLERRKFVTYERETKLHVQEKSIFQRKNLHNTNSIAVIKKETPNLTSLDKLTTYSRQVVDDDDNEEENENSSSTLLKDIANELMGRKNKVIDNSK